MRTIKVPIFAWILLCLQPTIPLWCKGYLYIRGQMADIKPGQHWTYKYIGNDETYHRYVTKVVGDEVYNTVSLPTQYYNPIEFSDTKADFVFNGECVNCK